MSRESKLKQLYQDMKKNPWVVADKLNQLIAILGLGIKDYNRIIGYYDDCPGGDYHGREADSGIENIKTIDYRPPFFSIEQASKFGRDYNCGEDFHIETTINSFILSCGSPDCDVHEFQLTDLVLDKYIEFNEAEDAKIKLDFSQCQID